MNGKNIDLILGLKLNEFFKANDKAWAAYSKTKGNIENRPINIKGTGQDLLKRITQIGAAYLTVTRLIPNLIKLSNEAELADARLATALKNVNQYSAENFKILKDQASAIQNITTVEDEQAQALQTLALNMGIGFGKLDEVTRGAIGLSAAFKDAGLSQETAMKGIALAYQGNFQQLQRYIPALRNAGTETEKMAILQRGMAAGFKLATDSAKTGAGQLEGFQITLGDVQEDLGDIVKLVLLPLVGAIKPVLSGFTELEEGTQQAVIATVALLAIGVKVPAMFAAIRTAIISLNASMGPAGWLILGITAAATAWSTYAIAADDAADAQERVNKAITSNVDKHLEALDKGLENLRVKTMPQLLDIQKRLSDRMVNAQQKGNLTLYEGYKKHYDRVTELIKSRNELFNKIEPLTKIFSPEGVQRIDLAQQEIEQKTESFYFDLSELSSQFTSDGIAALNDEYVRKKQLLDDYLQQVRDHVGLQSELYKRLALLRWALDLNYHRQKMTLEEKGAKELAGLGDEMMATFQGQSATLFGVGKALAVANLLITKGEAIARAFKDYPWPVNIAIAAIQSALVAGQLANIQSVEFQPKGKKSGGLIKPADIAGSAWSPRGEDGYIAAQIGEMVINRRAVRDFYPVLKQINDYGRRGFAQGGTVSGADLYAPQTGENAVVLAAVIQDAIIEGFNKSRLRITGNFKARGRDLQAALDKNNELKEIL